jgi:hypothetical protein
MNSRELQIWVFAAALPALNYAGAVRPAGVDLFPVKPGSSWTYRGSAGTQTANITAEVTSSQSRGGKTTAVLRWSRDGQTIQEETYSVSSQSVDRLKSGAYGAFSNNPPIPIITYPATIGKTWSWKGTQAAGDRKATRSVLFKMAASESVKTPAGTFSAYRIDMSVVPPQPNIKPRVAESRWYAPGVGMVQYHSSMLAGSGKTVEMTSVLTKYKIK